MKICKLVFNTVSHDARVLKEASTLKKMGHDVIIIGLQSPEGGCVPAEVLNNGVVINRINVDEVGSRMLTIRAMIYLLVTALFISFMAFGIDLTFMQDSMNNFVKVSQFPISQQVTIGFLLLLWLMISFKLGFKFIRRYVNRKKDYRDVLKELDLENSIYSSMLAPYQQKASKKKSLNLRFLFSLFSSFYRRLWKVLPRPLLLGPQPLLFKKGEMAMWLRICLREKRVFSQLNRFKPDVIHAHDLNTLPVAVKYKKANGVPLVFDAHELYEHLAQATKEHLYLNRLILKKHVGYVDRFITINQSIAKYYAEKHPALPPATVIMNATEKVPPFDYDGRLHEAADIAEDKKILLYQGGFASHRGLIPLVMSIEFLNDDWVLVFMGSGYMEEVLKTHIGILESRGVEVENKVKFVPKVPQYQLPYWTAGATVGIIPYENTSLNHLYCTPNKLWEYPNAGVPILVSKLEEMKKIVNRYNNGWFLPELSTAEGIAMVINNLKQEDLNEKRANCQTFIDDDNWAKYEDGLIKIYTDLELQLKGSSQHDYRMAV